MDRTIVALAGLFLIAVLLAACGDKSPSSSGASSSGASGSSTKGAENAGAGPKAALEGILALAEAGKWKECVSSYYGEQHKMTKPEEQIGLVAARLQKSGSEWIAVLRTCLDIEPVISADGNTATYSNQFKLHKDDGKWGFHL